MLDLHSLDRETQRFGGKLGERASAVTRGQMAAFLVTTLCSNRNKLTYPEPVRLSVDGVRSGCGVYSRHCSSTLWFSFTVA